MTKFRYRFWQLIGWLFRYPIKQVLLLQEPKLNPTPLVRSPSVWDQILRERFLRAEQAKQKAELEQEEFYRSTLFKSAFIKLIDYCLRLFESESGDINVSAYDVGINSDNPQFGLFRSRVIIILKEQGIKASVYGNNLICVNAKSFGKLVKKIKSGNFSVREKLETITEGPYR